MCPRCASLATRKTSRCPCTNIPPPSLLMTTTATGIAFCSSFSTGKCAKAAGLWFDHTLGWWHASQTSAHKHQIFWIYFEDLKKNPAPIITALAEFLGVRCDAQVLSKVMHASAFETMANSTAALANTSAEAKSRFANGGHSGRWRKHFNEGQNAAMDELYAAKINDSTAPGLRFDFE